MSKNSSAVDTTTKRWSSRAKQEVVLRLLSGESMEEISRQEQVELYRLQEWRDRALLGIGEAMKQRNQESATEKALSDAQSTIGKLTMELELFRGKGKRGLR